MADKKEKQGTAERAECSSKETASTENAGNMGFIMAYEKPFIMVKNTGTETEDEMRKIEDYLKEFNMKLRNTGHGEYNNKPTGR